MNNTTIIVKNGSGKPEPASLQEAELAIDVVGGDLYTKLGDEIVHLNDGGSADGGTGSSVHIGENPPADPQEGQQWMEVPASGDATMWIYDGGKWLQQPGGKDGAPGLDGKDGVDAVWSEVTPDGDIYYDKGNVGVGNDSPNARLTVGTTIGVDIDGMMATIPSAQINPFIHAVSNTYNTGSVAGDLCIASRTNVPASVRFFTGDSGPVERLKIDASGDATFSGEVNAATVKATSANSTNVIQAIGTSVSTFIRPNGIVYCDERGGFQFTPTAIRPADGKGSIAAADAHGVYDLGLAGAAWKDGHFSGTVNAGTIDAVSFGRSSSGAGISFTIGADSKPAIFPTAGPGMGALEDVSLGASTARFNNGWFRGDIYKNGSNSPMVDGTDIIRVLSTLRNATKDETTLEGLRDAIGNAIGGLIEEFENQIATMPAGDES